MAKDDFTISRDTFIAASPEAIFPLIDDLHAWAGWSPWEGVPGDDLRRTYSGAERGLGAVYEWTGKKTGQGRMEITESTPAERVRTDLLFLNPFKAQNEAVFTLTPVAGGTAVTWTMTGEKTFMSRLMGLVMNMDKMLGVSFEKGLAKMKTIAEAVG